ncbi:SAF domain-containing protein [Salinifilum ghardaiensis]
MSEAHGTAEAPHARLVGKLRTARLVLTGPRLHTARRIAAVLLLCCSGVLAFVPSAQPDGRAHVLAAARDLPPGEPLTRTDLTRRAVPGGALPHGAFTRPEQVLGRTPATPVRAGEAITDVRLLGPAATRASTGDPDSAAVPIRLADPAVATFLDPGHRVDLVSAAHAAEPAVLAENAPVLAVRAPDPRDSAERMVLVGLPRGSAAAVAAASARESVTVALR